MLARNSVAEKRGRAKIIKIQRQPPSLKLRKVKGIFAEKIRILSKADSYLERGSRDRRGSKIV